jgi:hypothetical protein
MQLADKDDEAIANEAGLQAYFVYYEPMEEGDVPVDVTHVRIDSSVLAIKDWAFYRREQLRIVILNEELEKIGRYAFNWCTSLEKIAVPNAVWAIEYGAFRFCTGLTRVTLGDGLEEIGERAFAECTSMEEIVIPDNVRAIEYGAFRLCTGLTRVTLGDGLEEIGTEAFGRCTSIEEILIPNNVKEIKYKAFRFCTRLTRVTLGDVLEKIGGKAFQKCTSIEEIVIPPAVKEIHGTAFKGCSNLTRVRFSDEIEHFVSHKAMQVWWNQGIHERCLSTYCFLVRCSIPARCSGLTPVKSWQANINDMLGSIPTFFTADSYSNDEDADDDSEYEDEEDLDDEDEVLNEYFDAINARLTVYENMREAPKLLGLVIANDDIVERVLSYF